MVVRCPLSACRFAEGENEPYEQRCETSSGPLEQCPKLVVVHDVQGADVQAAAWAVGSPYVDRTEAQRKEDEAVRSTRPDAEGAVVALAALEALGA